ncbi:hypothetical protein C2845_PM01G46010 [Panicum miliaceum]|uniref:Uncharacterized protein n=1 Tax=Panicum miliaceum TaxID=4540 RepID=A0A3L6TMT1_PANMI|nr:hypothetical protein C2845_PM01G46010 [Panicum miliaceum]
MRAALGDGAADLAVHEPEVNLCLMLWRLAQQKSTQADLTTAANKEPLAAKFGPFHYVLLAGRVRVFEREACLQSKTMALPRCLHCIQGYIFRGAYWLRFWTQLQQHEA